MARSWCSLLIVCLLSQASLSGSAKRHKSRSRGLHPEREPADGPHRASFVNGTNILDWSRDPRRVDQQIYDQVEAGWEFFGWPYALSGQLEGQELPAGLVKGDRVEPKSKDQLLVCNGYIKLDDSLIFPDDHYCAKNYPYCQTSLESPLMQHLEKYPIMRAEDFPTPPGDNSFREFCPKGEVPCTSYTLKGRPKTQKGQIGGTSLKFVRRIQRLLNDYGPLALYMESDARNIDGKGFLKIEQLYSFRRRISHAVLLVGYGHTDSEEYFKFKNSRGSKWGDNGYGYLRVAEDSPPLRGEIELFNIKPCPMRLLKADD